MTGQGNKAGSHRKPRVSMLGVKAERRGLRFPANSAVAHGPGSNPVPGPSLEAASTGDGPLAPEER